MSTAAPLFEPSGYGPCGAVQMSSAVLFRFCRINIKLNIYRTCFIEENYITIIIVIVLSPSPASKYICSRAPPVNSCAPPWGGAPPRLGTTDVDSSVPCQWKCKQVLNDCHTWLSTSSSSLHGAKAVSPGLKVSISAWKRGKVQPVRALNIYVSLLLFITVPEK